MLNCRIRPSVRSTNHKILSNRALSEVFFQFGVENELLVLRLRLHRSKCNPVICSGSLVFSLLVFHNALQGFTGVRCDHSFIRAYGSPLSRARRACESSLQITRQSSKRKILKSEG